MKVIRTRYFVLTALFTLLTVNGRSQTAELSFDPQSTLHVRGDIERAMWIWSTENIVYNVGTAKADFFDFCVHHKGVGDAQTSIFTQRPITRLFFYAHGFITSGPEEEDSLRAFLREAHARGIAVDYLDGGPTWINKGGNDANNSINAVLRFNASGNPEERFDGIQLDIAPYRLPGWYSDLIWDQYLTFLQRMRSKIKGSQNPIRFGITIPRWYDETLGIDSLKRIYNLVDYVALLDYVNDETRLINDASTEIALADKMDVAVYLGVETNLNFLETVSYQNKGWLQMESDLTKLNDIYMFDKNYAGVAIHSYSGYRNLHRTTRSLEYANDWTEVGDLNAPDLQQSDADIIVFDSFTDKNIGISNLKQEIVYVQTKGTSEQKRLVVANLPLIDAFKPYNVSTRLELINKQIKAGIIPKNGFEEYWTGCLSTEIRNYVMESMHTGFDGVVIDITKPLSLARFHDLPRPENEMVDMLAEVNTIVREENPKYFSTMIIRLGSNFIDALDEKHRMLFMSIADGVIITDLSVENDKELLRNGIKVFRGNNFHKTDFSLIGATHNVSCAGTTTTH